MRVHGALVLAVALVGAACDNGSSSLTVPSTATATATTETFSGSVDVGGVAFHPFTITQAGAVNITLVSAGPPATIFMGLGIGLPSGSTCTLLASASTVTQAGTVAQLSGTAQAGSYCVQVYDVGNQLASISYTVTVSHF